MQNPSAPTIFLASSSPYRRGLLDRFLDHYETVSPEIDESNDQGLPADELTSYLARKKAEAVAINAIIQLGAAVQRVELLLQRLIDQRDGGQLGVT